MRSNLKWKHLKYKFKVENKKCVQLTIYLVKNQDFSELKVSVLLHVKNSTVQ